MFLSIFSDQTIADLQNVPRRVLTDIPTEHMYLRMAETDIELVNQVQRIKDLELANFFLVSNDTNAEKFLGQVSSPLDKLVKL